MPDHEAGKRYTIGELAEAAGVTTRTIRYYTAEELLPPPDARGKYALYSHEHLLRLLLIARLKDTYLPLGEIRSRLQRLSAAQIAELLRAPAAPPAKSSAADYIAQVLGAQPGGRSIAEPPAPYAAPAPARAAMPAAPPPQVGVATPLPPAPHAAPQPADGEQRWRRMTLAPGVELHIAEPLPETIQRSVDQIVSHARRVLHAGDHPALSSDVQNGRSG